MKKNKIVTNFLLVVAISIFYCCNGVLAYNSEEAVNYYNKGIEYVSQENYQEASLAFQKALELDPDMVDAYYNLGSIYEYFGDFQTALRAYGEVIMLDPRDFGTTLKVGELYVKLNKNDEAIYILKDIPPECAEYAQAQNIIKKIVSEQQAQKKVKSTSKQTSAKKVQKKSPQVTETPDNEVKNEEVPANTMEGRTPNGGYTDPDKSLLSKYSSPTGIAIDESGNVFVASFAENAIYIVSPDEKSQLFSDSPMIDGPIGIAIDTSGCLYVANYNKDNILRITPDGNVAIYKSNVNKPYSVSVYNNVLYVSEQGSNSVVKYQL